MAKVTITMWDKARPEIGLSVTFDPPLEKGEPETDAQLFAVRVMEAVVAEMKAEKMKGETT